MVDIILYAPVHIWMADGISDIMADKAAHIGQSLFPLLPGINPGKLQETAAGTAAASGPSAGSGGGRTAGQVCYHTVRKGETLWGIARRYGISLEVLLEWNPGIKNPNYITMGQKVRVT